MASDTAHCGQKQILCAFDFCRGFTPTVCANMYTATDLCPASISRLQRRQTIGCTGIPLCYYQQAYPLSVTPPRTTSKKKDSHPDKSEPIASADLSVQKSL
jgi:hypothetical protein